MVIFTYNYDVDIYEVNDDGNYHILGSYGYNITFGIEEGSYRSGDLVTITEYHKGVPVEQHEERIMGVTDTGIFVHLDSDYYELYMSTEPHVGGWLDIVNAGTYTTCFLSGTMIATPAGERAVEDLAIGDLVLNASGEIRPVRWIGRQTVQRMFADPLRSYPICISAGALDDNIPTRDLFVSPDHALLVDGLMVQACALVNGTSITGVERPDERFTYFHIELEDHALVLAEGAPAETFVDNVTRRRFDNYAEFEALYGEEGGLIDEIDLPRVKSARQLPASIRARLEARAGISSDIIAA